MKCHMAHHAAGRLFRRSQNRMHVQKALMELLLLGRVNG
jgi:ornithine carbamoyltransferase